MRSGVAGPVEAVDELKRRALVGGPVRGPTPRRQLRLPPRPAARCRVRQPRPRRAGRTPRAPGPLAGGRGRGGAGPPRGRHRRAPRDRAGQRPRPRGGGGPRPLPRRRVPTKRRRGWSGPPTVPSPTGPARPPPTSTGERPASPVEDRPADRSRRLTNLGRALAPIGGADEASAPSARPSRPRVPRGTPATSAGGPGSPRRARRWRACCTSSSGSWRPGSWATRPWSRWAAAMTSTRPVCGWPAPAARGRDQRRGPVGRRRRSGPSRQPGRPATREAEWAFERDLAPRPQRGRPRHARGLAGPG